MAGNFFTDISEDDKRTNVLSTISSPVWSDGAATLTAFYTSSVQSGSSGNYYYDIYNKAGSDSTRQVQFAVAYGHIEGSGSLSTSDGNNPSKAIYRQFRNICLQNPTSGTRFNFDGSSGGKTAGSRFEAEDIFVINVNRARYREKIDPGNWELHLSGSVQAKGAIGGISNIIKLIDDSESTSDSTVKASQRVFNIVSGSIAGGSTSIKTSGAAQSDGTNGSYGQFYPELGLMVLNAQAVSASLEVSGSSGIKLTRSGGANNNTSFELVEALQPDENGTGYFRARREEQIKSSHYFCRVTSDQYNYSQNPTYFTGSNAELQNPSFVQDPKAYITTVGLYNNNNELLAVAKLSQPLLKSKDREAVIKVRLDF